MKILVCGDSFAADWTVKYSGSGWPNLLASRHSVTNLAQAGCSEYKIYLQLKSVDLTQFDKIIVSHTSPNRIYTKYHPVHHSDKLHGNSDLIYTDLIEHSKTVKGLDPIIHYFEQHFDTDHARFMHSLLCEKIDDMLNPYDVLHIANLFWDDLYQFPDMRSFYHLFRTNRGLMNHYDDDGNMIVFNEINSWIENV